MRTATLSLTSLLLVSNIVFGGINDELINIFNTQHAAALVFAEEKEIINLDLEENGQTFVMHFDPAKAFVLKDGVLGASLKSAIIQQWTFGMSAPWTRGKRSSWVVLNNSGHPFLSLRLIADQPSLIVISQVIPLNRGVASLGRPEQYLFRCELTSKDFAAFLRSTVKKKQKKKFVPASLELEEEVDDDPFGK